MNLAPVTAAVRTHHGPAQPAADAASIETVLGHAGRKPACSAASSIASASACTWSVEFGEERGRTRVARLGQRLPAGEAHERRAFAAEPAGTPPDEGSSASSKRRSAIAARTGHARTACEGIAFGRFADASSRCGTLLVGVVGGVETPQHELSVADAAPGDDFEIGGLDGGRDVERAACGLLERPRRVASPQRQR